MPMLRSTQTLSILVVDDDLGLLAVIGDMIEFLNHKCIKADSGRAAVKLLSRGSWVDESMVALPATLRFMEEALVPGINVAPRPT